MPKTAKKRTKTKPLASKKKKVSAAQMKKVKGGHSYSSINFVKGDLADGLLVPAVQKVRE